MGRLGLQLAKLFGQQLPAFKSQAEAEERLFAQRDARVNLLAAVARRADGVFTADFSPASLKGLELWYFALRESDDFSSLGLSREEFERSMAMYFCETAVRNCPQAKWIVREYAFEPGKYELGVQRGQVCLMRSRFTDHYKQPNNKRRQKIYLEYQKRFGD